MFSYRNNEFFVEDVALRSVAEAVGTPFYCYSRKTIETNFDAYRDALHGLDALICYALKANSNQSIIGLLGKRGAGADVVSEGELRRALAAGIDPSRIVFSGVAKTAPEIEFALEQDILQFNVESIPELLEINSVAERMGKTARVSFRVNPDVDAGTHEKISTGKSENKFGIPIADVRESYARAAQLPGIKVTGVDIHIGSQITRLQPYEQAFDRIANLISQLRDDGHSIETVDLGGGLGINYDEENDRAPSPADYVAVVRNKFESLGCRLILEPGRSLVGNAGILASSVVYVKTGGKSRFLIVDAAMNDFLRPSMYDAYHDIVSGTISQALTTKYDVVGPVCETGDTFARGRTLPELDPGDLIVIKGAGAYGSVMSSSYNTRPVAPEVLVDGNNYGVIRNRLDYDSMIELDQVWPEDIAD